MYVHGNLTYQIACFAQAMIQACHTAVFVFTFMSMNRYKNAHAHIQAYTDHSYMHEHIC